MKTETLFEGIVSPSIVKAVTEKYEGEFVRLRIELMGDAPKPKLRREKHGYYLSTVEIKAIERLHTRGKTNKVIAKELHRSETTVGRVLRKNAL